MKRLVIHFAALALAVVASAVPAQADKIKVVVHFSILGDIVLYVTGDRAFGYDTCWTKRRCTRLLAKSHRRSRHIPSH
ncbi:MAG: hypothetical protein ACR2PG_09770 [Hyphomicrobiaceae bacterium]